MSSQRLSPWWLVVAAMPVLVLLANTVVPTAVPAANALKEEPAVSPAAELAAAAQALVEPLEFQVAPAAVLVQTSEEVCQKGEVLALIAGAVGSEYGDVKWKPNAPAVRDAAVELAKASKEQDSNRASEALKRIKELIAGSDGGSGDGEPKEPLQMITLHHVMQEVQHRHEPLRDQLKSPAAFDKSKKQIAQDAGVLAVLAAAVRTDVRSASKAMKPQSTFERLAGELYAASAALQQAAWDGKYPDAEATWKGMGRICADCHRDYRPQQ